MKVNICWGDLTDISAKKEALLTTDHFSTIYSGSPKPKPIFKPFVLSQKADLLIKNRDACTYCAWNHAPNVFPSYTTRPVLPFSKLNKIIFWIL